MKNSLTLCLDILLHKKDKLKEVVSGFKILFSNPTGTLYGN
jgi:hypothetical protein